MRGRTINLTGKKYGRLQVIAQDGATKYGSVMWKCKCKCGTVKTVDGQTLRGGTTVSCGCWRSESLKKGREALHRTNVTHGKSKTKEHKIWVGMIHRCHCSTAREYSEYGGRGIVVCNRWRKSFVTFLSDMGNMPSAKHTIDRKDNDGDYEPKNCRWATRKEQANNRRGNMIIAYKGRKQTLKQWAEELNKDPYLLYDRLRRGWNFLDAISTPKLK